MAYQGINFRETAGYRTDNAGETYARGEVYPTTRAGQTFGCDVSLIGNGRDRSLTYDVRIAGILFSQNNAVRNFRYDLPATGVGTIRLGLGDSAGGSTHHIQLLDGGVVFATLSPTTVVGGNSTFADAAGNLWSEGAWPANNVAITHTFTSTNFTIRMGDGSSSGITCLTHVSVDMAGASAGATINLAISNLSSAGTLSTGAATVTPAAPNTANLQISNLASVGTLSTAAATVTPAQGTLTSDIFAAWGSPAPLAGLTIPRVVALKHDGTVALNLANQVTNGAGRIVLVSASLVAGTQYMLGTWDTANPLTSRGFKAYTAT